MIKETQKKIIKAEKNALDAESNKPAPEVKKLPEVPQKTEEERRKIANAIKAVIKTSREDQEKANKKKEDPKKE